MNDSKQKKVMFPIERDGKTFWAHGGRAFVNKDNSINVYLETTPLKWDGKLQVRDWDERPRTQTHEAVAPYGSLRPITGGASDTSPNEELPF